MYIFYKKIIKYLEENILMILLVVLSVITYFRWLSFDYFVYADNVFQHNVFFIENFLPSVWRSDHSIGHLDVAIWKKTLTWFQSLISIIFCVDSNVTEKIVLFIPVITLLPVSSYLLLKRLTKSSIASFFGSLVMMFNTYFLSINSQGHLPLTLSCVFANFSLLTYIEMLKTKKNVYLVSTTILLFITGLIDFRFFYIEFGIILLYTLLFFVLKEKETMNLKDCIKSIIFLLIFLVLLNSFWLLPQLQSSTLIHNEILGRNLIFQNHWGIKEVFAVYHAFFGTLPDWRSISSATAVSMFVPIVVTISLLLCKKNLNLIFFAALSIIGIFFAKQSSAPFEDTYTWFFNNFPGFSAFREATKFYYLIILGYSGLIAYLIKLVIKHSKKNYYINKYKFVFFGILFFVLFSNSFGVISGKLESLYIKSNNEMLGDYKILEDFLNKNAENYKVLYVPKNSKWIVQTMKHPKIDMTVTVEKTWKKLERENRVFGYPYISILMNHFSEELLNVNSIKYVVIPKKLNEGSNSKDFSEYFNKDRNFYIDILDNLNYLKKIDINTEEVVIYENSRVKPRLYLTDEVESIYNEVLHKDIYFKIFAPHKYHFKINNLNDTTFLNFSDQFDSNWKLKIGTQHNWLSGILFTNYYMLDEFHFFNNASLNFFKLDSDYIKENYSKSFYKENLDGTIDVELILYHKSQNYFYLGLYISFCTFVVLILYFFYLTRIYDKK